MESRILTVSSISSYNYKSVPFIRIQGKWLEKMGFTIGDKIVVSSEKGHIIIRFLHPGKDI